MKTFSSKGDAVSIEMFTGDSDYILQQIKSKTDEILKLIQMLPLEAKQFTKNLLTERIHEIFLALDSAQNTINSQDFDCLEGNAFTNKSTSNCDLDQNGPREATVVADNSAMPGYDSFKMGNSTAMNIRTMQTNEHSPNQYLIQGIQGLGETQGTQAMDEDVNIQQEHRGDLNSITAGNPEIGIDDLENDEATQQLMDEIDDIKPKSNMPFIKDGTPDTTYTTNSEDVSSLLSFLPQLSPYMQLDLRDGTSVGEKEGIIHLTLERADGSVQNLKIAAIKTTSAEDCAAIGNEKKIKPNSGDKKLSLIQKQLAEKECDPFKDQKSTMEIENDPFKDQTSTLPPEVVTSDKSQVPNKERPRGRPRKQEMFNSTTLENGQKVFVCSICHAFAQTQYAMEVHMRRHSGEKPFSCELCEKSFTTKGNLKNHMVTHNDDKPWTCSYCNKKFKENRVLVIHQRTHTGERPYKCTLCDKSFTQSGVLKEHLLVHSGQKPHLCDLCGQEFRGLSSLRAHKLRHLKKKAFKCDKCEMDFICQADLSRHDLTHTGLRPFMCSLCPKTFTRLNYLKEHLNIHYGSRPFSCTVCTAAFPDSVSLLRHKRKHNAEKEEANKQAKQMDLQTHVIIEDHSPKLTPNMPSFEIMQQTQFGDQSFQMVLNDNSSLENIQKLQLLISSANTSHINTGQDMTQPMQPIYQVMCMNPDTQEIVEPARNDQVVVEGQSAYLSAINMLANATSQQNNFSIQ